ncbi:MAG: hypothetical protein MUF31_16375 [Akkermansiaceae bacterium]|nr:hypothetical protein [Akkermansiaceae bacterium]
MKSKLILTAIALTAATATARELAIHECPQPVRSTIESNARGGMIEEVDWVAINGKEIYVAEVDLPRDTDLKIYVAADGQLIKIREDLAFAEAPQEVRNTLGSFGGRVDDLDRETEGSTVTYYAEIERSGQSDLKLTLDASGRVTQQYEDHDD